MKIELHSMKSASYLQLIRSVICKYDIYFLVLEYDLQSHALCIHLFTICFVITISLFSFPTFLCGDKSVICIHICVYLTSAYFSVIVPRKCDLIVPYHIPHIQLFLLHSTYLIPMAVFLPNEELNFMFSIPKCQVKQFRD